MSRYFSLFLGVALVLAPSVSYAQVLISELMAVNDSVLADEDGDYPDWIEIHNAGAAAVNLAGWYLTDDLTDLRKWQVPTVTVPADGYLVVFASGKDRAPVAGELHTNFQLDGDGEYLGLVRADGATVASAFAPAFPSQRRDVAYGVQDPAHPDNLLFFTTSTPGSANGDGIAGYVADTTFTVDRGYFTNSFDVEILCATVGASIRFTTDASEPSSTQGTLYTGPIRISGTTVLRAVAYFGGLLPSNVDTQTYLFMDEVVNQPDLPSGWPSVWNGGYRDYEMDPEIVDDPDYVDRIRPALVDLPIIAVATDQANLFGSTGIYDNPTKEGVAWERPCSVEIFYPDGQRSDIQVNAGLRIQGGASRLPAKSGKHSFRLLFKDVYGPTKLRHNLFGGDAVEAFDTIVLRAGFNQSWIHHNTFKGDNRGRAQYARDQFAKDAQRAMGGVAPHNRCAHLFVNGLYWGVYNPSERPAASFGAAYHGGEKEEYDALNSGSVVDGNSIAWVELFNRAAEDLSIEANYLAVAEMLDLEAFIDYMILHQYGGNQDWDSHNWYAYRRRVPGAKWYFASWDSEFIFIDPLSSSSLGGIEGDYDPPNGRGPLALQRSLDDHVGFRLWYADRVHHHLFNTGVLAPANAAALYSEQTQEIDRAIIAESARWGDFRRDVLPSGSFYTSDGLYDRDDEWMKEQSRLLTYYFPVRATETVKAYRNRSPRLYPTVSAPEFSQHGGDVPFGFVLAISNPGGSGTVYVTTDGADPRDNDGSPSATATVYSGPVTLVDSVRVRARVWSGGTWSALCDATFYVPDPPALRVTELMYNPAAPTTAEVSAGYGDNDDFEYLELLNVGATPLDLRGFRFTDGFQLDFGGLGSPLALGAGERVVVVRNLSAFQLRYGHTIPVAGVYTNSLNNAGENLRLETQIGQTVLDFDYNDSWYPSTDGEGFALEIIDPTGPREDWGKRPSWRASWNSGGTPGGEDVFALNPDTIVINEALTHTDASPVGDWIELHNSSDQPITIGDWYLSDDPAIPQKYRIAAGTELAADAYLVFSQFEHFGVGSGDPGVVIPFGLSELGETVVLSAGVGGELRGYRVIETFGAAASEVAFGRHIKTTGKSDFPAMSANTPAEPNAGPSVGPIVLSEIQYHPVDGQNEFLELRNITDRAVRLYDEAFPTNRWQLSDAVWFTFPENTTIAAHQLFLVVRDEPNAFRSAYGIPADIPVYGPYTGALDNAGENLVLHRPGKPEIDGAVPLIVADRVNYKDGDLWPELADGMGPSLRRIDTQTYGNDAGNWEAGHPGGSPGNIAPHVNAGSDVTVYLTQNSVSVSLSGEVTDDGRPSSPGAMALLWTQDSGPSPAIIGSPASAETTVEFDAGGTYVLQLTADDGAHPSFDRVTVTVVPPTAKEVLITESENSTRVTEDGETDFYQVQLSVAPEAGTDVRVGVVSVGSYVTVSPTELVFTVATWNEPQSITVQAVDDDVDRGETYADTLEHTVISNDPGFLVNPLPVVPVTVVDDEQLGEGWPYAMKMTFEGYAGSETLVDFPVLVRLSEDLSGFDYAQFADPNGGDLRFTDGARSVELPYEVETWDPDGVSLVWVRVAALENPQSFLWAFWGQAGLAAPGYTTDGSAWSGNYVGVWHLAGTAADASPFGNHGTPINTGYTSALVGMGGEFDGSSAYVTVDGVAQDIGDTDFSAGGWIRTTRSSKQMQMSVNEPGGVNVWRIAMGEDPPDGGTTSVGDGNNYECPTDIRIDDDNWHQVIYTRSGSVGRLFVNGVERGSHTANFTFSSDHFWVLGQEWDSGPRPSDFFDGLIDELRVATVPRSADWIQAEFQNVAEHDAWLRYDPVIDPSAPQGYAAWQVTMFPNPDDPAAQPTADWDQDGTLNLLEYALGSDPTDPADPGETTPFAFVLPSDWPTVSYTRSATVADAELTVQFTTNLVAGNWIWGPGAVNEAVIATDGVSEQVEATVIDPARDHDGFWGARLRVDLIDP